MPSNVIKYRVFIASPGGLDNLRQVFHKTLDEYNRLEAIPRGAMFEPVGWEATMPGVGRPQELINEDIRSCDRAVFLFRDRWGSSTGIASEYSFGLRRGVGFVQRVAFRRSDAQCPVVLSAVLPAQLKDPGAQLGKVLAFRKQIEDGRQHLCKNLIADDEFAAELRASLGMWLRQHEGGQPRDVQGDRHQRPSAPLQRPIGVGVSAHLLTRAITADRR